MDENVDMIAEQDKLWAIEQSWPIYRVFISGDSVEWVPRADERYWKQQDPNNPNTTWVPKDAADLPEDASIHPDSGAVVRTATAVVVCHAQSEDHAKMLALRDNAEYHTVDKVELVN